MESEEVILVNEADEATGIMEKIEAHRKGILHRAFSVFIFNTKGEMLLQQRALNKYHSGGLWTNACCSHPRPGEDTMEAAKRRLKEEMGFETTLIPVFEFTYQSEFNNGLTEHEYDHVVAGYYDGPVMPDRSEVMEYCFKSREEISSNLQSHPEKYTVWFHLAFPMMEKLLKQNASGLSGMFGLMGVMGLVG